MVFGYHEIGYVCLEEVINSGCEVNALFTHEDDPGEKIWFRKPEEVARRHGIPVYTPTDLKDERWARIIASYSPDFIFSFYYRYMIPKEILTIPRIGAFNLHGSLLPKYRGRAPINWVIIHGEKKTGVTLHYMVEKPDAGDIVAQREVEITFEDTAYTLFMKMAEAARLLMRDTMPRLMEGTFERYPQVGPSSYFGGRRPEDGLIPWDKDALSIYNLIRAVTHPYPGAFTYVEGKKLFIWKAYPIKGNTEHTPGKVITTRPLTVATGKGILRLISVQYEGEEEMMGEEFTMIHDLENKILGG
ncbi:MAG: formyltransferase [Syntrophorhabdaceae bacterium]|nr:formyltransferase [Syntrophorhabdaceae bacterium]